MSAWGTSDLTDTIFLSHAHSSIANELSPLLLATPRLVTFSPVNGYVTHLYGPEETPVINTVTLWKFPAELSRRERIEVRYLFYDEGYALQPRCDMWKHGCNGWKGGWVRSDQVFVEGALDDGSSTEVQAEREKDDANKNLGDHEDLILNGNDSVRAWLSVGAWKKPGNREKWEESDEWKVLQKRWEEKAFLGRETWTVKFKQLATSASGSKAQ